MSKSYRFNQGIESIDNRIQQDLIHLIDDNDRFDELYEQKMLQRRLAEIKKKEAEIAKKIYQLKQQYNQKYKK